MTPDMGSVSTTPPCTSSDQLRHGSSDSSHSTAGVLTQIPPGRTHARVVPGRPAGVWTRRARRPAPAHACPGGPRQPRPLPCPGRPHSCRAADTMRNIPVVLTRADVAAVLSLMHGTAHLVATRLSGSGWRSRETVRVRIRARTPCPLCWGASPRMPPRNGAGWRWLSAMPNPSMRPRAWQCLASCNWCGKKSFTLHRWSLTGA